MKIIWDFLILFSPHDRCTLNKKNVSCILKKTLEVRVFCFETEHIAMLSECIIVTSRVGGYPSRGKSSVCVMFLKHRRL